MLTTLRKPLLEAPIIFAAEDGIIHWGVDQIGTVSIAVAVVRAGFAAARFTLSHDHLLLTHATIASALSIT
jgi:hypothetical protein